MRITFESSKGVSFSDIIRFSSFSHLTPFDLLSPEYDEDVKPYLYDMGIDTNLRIDVQACLHRNMSGHKAVGYRYIGFERTDEKWLKNPQCTMAARLASQEDPSLAAEMKGMSTEGMSGAAYMAMCAKAKGTESAIDDYFKVETEESSEDDTKMMKLLRDIQIEVRGGLSPDEDLFGVGVGK